MSPLANSALIAGCSTCAACVIGVLAAFALVAVSPSRRLAVSLLVLSVLPLLVPSYVLVSFWMEALGANGWLSRLIADGRAVPLNGLAPTIAMLALIYWSPVALICYYTLTKIDRAMIEAAELSLGKPRATLRVIAPLLWPSLAVSAALVFVLTFSNFSVPAIFQVKTIQNEIYVQFNANFDVGKAFLFALPQLVAACVGLLYFPWLLRKRGWMIVPARPAGEHRGVWKVCNSCHDHYTRYILWQRMISATFLVAVVVLSAVGPLVRAVGSVIETKILWQTLVVSASQIWNSFWFAFLAATIVLALAVAVSPFRRLGSIGNRQSAIGNLLFIPFVLPEVLIGIALIAIFNRPSLQWIYTSVAIVLIALAVRYFIVGKFAVSIGRSHIDPSLLEAAQLAGLSRLGMLFRIQLPLLSRWLFAGWWLTYLFCLADVGSLVLIYPPGCDTVPIRIFNLLHYGYDAQVSALCLVMLVLGAVPLCFLRSWALGRRLFEPI